VVRKVNKLSVYKVSDHSPYAPPPPNPLVRRGVRTTGSARIPPLTKEGLGVVVLSVYKVSHHTYQFVEWYSLQCDFNALTICSICIPREPLIKTVAPAGSSCFK